MYLNNLGRLREAVWRNPFINKSEHAKNLGLTNSTITKLWKQLREDHEAYLERETHKQEK